MYRSQDQRTGRTGITCYADAGVEAKQVWGAVKKAHQREGSSSPDSKGNRRSRRTSPDTRSGTSTGKTVTTDSNLDLQAEATRAGLLASEMEHVVSRLTGMGFGRAASIKACVAAKGKIREALEMLMAG